MIYRTFAECEPTQRIADAGYETVHRFKKSASGAIHEQTFMYNPRQEQENRSIPDYNFSTIIIL